MAILVLNAGSGTVKFGLFDFETLEPLGQGLLDWAGQTGQATVSLQTATGNPVQQSLEVPTYRQAVLVALELLQQCLGSFPTEPSEEVSKRAASSGASRHGVESRVGRKIRVIGHRLIHGGEEIRSPVWIDAAMKETIARYRHLAPLHIPAGLEAIEAVEEALPGIPQVGLFDTAFFADILPTAYLYPVPYEWYTQWGIRRYGFHGTSHAYCTERAAELLGRPQEELDLIICHLGQGSSATAVQRGKAITNTMGFTPLEGFMMGTRSGTVDPGILLYVMREHGLSVEDLDYILHHRSGLLGVSGLSSDFRQVEASAAQGNDRARLALDVYAYRVRAMVGSLAVTLGRLDALVFTGGIGENSAWLRGEVCRGLECLGVHLDRERNAQCRADTDLAQADSPARVLLIHTREDYMIARQARDMLLKRESAESR